MEKMKVSEWPGTSDGVVCKIAKDKESYDAFKETKHHFGAFRLAYIKGYKPLEQDDDKLFCCVAILNMDGSLVIRLENLVCENCKGTGSVTLTCESPSCDGGHESDCCECNGDGFIEYRWRKLDISGVPEKVMDGLVPIYNEITGVQMRLPGI